MSLKILLQQKISAEGQVSRDALRIFGRQNNFDVDTVGIKLHQLTEESIIKPIFKDNYIIAYQAVRYIKKDDLNVKKRVKSDKVDLAAIPQCFGKYRATNAICQKCEYAKFCEPKIKERVIIREQNNRLL